MLRVKTTIAILAGLLLTTAAFANSLAATAAAAVDGNFGLELTYDGAANNFFVLDQSPNAEKTYRASFWVEEGTLQMTNCGAACSTQFMFLAAQQVTDGKTVLRIIVGRMVTDDGTGERHLYRFSVKNDNDAFLYVGGFILNGVVRRKHVTIEWQSGDVGVANGVARLYTSNDGGTPNLQGQIFYQNSNYQVDQIVIGGVAGLGDQASDAMTNGTVNFDSFSSFRTLLP